jgi:hypothetical protein
VRYHYKEGNARKLPTTEVGYGFVAQELQAVFPEAVKQNEDGYLSIDMHPVLVSYVNAIQEQQAQISKLQEELNALKKLLLEKK